MTLNHFFSQSQSLSHFLEAEQQASPADAIHAFLQRMEREAEGNFRVAAASVCVLRGLKDGWVRHVASQAIDRNMRMVEHQGILAK